MTGTGTGTGTQTQTQTWTTGVTTIALLVLRTGELKMNFIAKVIKEITVFIIIEVTTYLSPVVQSIVTLMSSLVV